MGFTERLASLPLTPSKNPRSTELGLVLMADGVTVALNFLAALGAKGHAPTKIWLTLLTIVAMSLFAHGALLRFAPKSSQVLLPIATLLNGIGYVEIARWNPTRAGYQAFWSLMSTVILVATVALLKRSRDLDRYRFTMLAAALVLMVLPLVPKLGKTTYGARLWVGIGPVTFQPIEIAKILLALFFASYFASNSDLLSQKTRTFRGRAFVDPRILIPVVLMLGLALAVLAAENDLGFAMMLVALFLSLLWVSTGRLSYVLIGVSLLGVTGYIASSFFYQVHQRFNVWINPWTFHAYNHGGQQLLGGWFSMAGGGVIGTGVGLGQSGRWVSEITSDMILSTIGEELGLLGIFVVLSALVLYFSEGIRIAQRSRNDFSRLAATGLSVNLAFQTFFICAGILRLLPLTGITLPFVAYGGSSLMANYIIMGMLLRISDENAQTLSGGFVRADALIPR